MVIGAAIMLGVSSVAYFAGWKKLFNLLGVWIVTR